MLLVQLLADALVSGAFYALLGLSWNLIYAPTRTFHFAHGVTFAAAAYTAVLVDSNSHLPVWLCCVFGVLMGGVVGVAIEVVVYRPLRGAGVTPMGLFLASMGLFIAGENALQLIFGPDNRALVGITIESYSIDHNQVTITNIGIAVVVAAVVITVALSAYEKRGKWGRALWALSDNPPLAETVGVPLEWARVLSFLGGSLLVGVAAIYFTVSASAYPTMGGDQIIFGLIAMFLGGVGSTRGVALGGLVLGLAGSLGTLYLPSQWQNTVAFGVLFVLLLVRPQGLLGTAAA